MASLSFIPIGGVGNVTKNMYVYECNGDILLVDCGLGFPTEPMLGVDLLIPDISYVLQNKSKVKGMILTHGHEDHIGGLPYLFDALPRFPILGSRLTAALANAKLTEFGYAKAVKTVGFDDKIQIGNFSIRLIRVTHSILDTTHFVIETPAGTFYHGSDFKFDKTPVDGKPTELNKIEEASKKDIVCLFLDSLRSEKEGHTPSEAAIEENFEAQIQECKGQFIVTTYSSNISRLNQAIRVAQKRGRKICFVGRSLEKAKEVAQTLGYLELSQGSEIRADQVKKYPKNQVCLLIAGSQGQENSALTRIANDEDKFIRIFEDDVVIFSADPIPGNEVAVHSLIDTLSRKGARVFYSEITDDLHVSGHAAKDDLKDMIKLVKPKYLLPIGGTYRQMVQFRLLALEMGFKKEEVFIIDNGQEVIFENGSARLGRKTPIKNVYVDEITGSEIHHFVLRDRQKLAQDGVIVLLIEIDTAKAEIVGVPDIITRGFVTGDEKWLANAIRKEIKKTIDRHRHKVTNWGILRKTLEGQIEAFIFQKTRRRPLVLPIVIEV